MPSIAIVGATGAVGIELVACCHQNISVLGDSPPRLFASARSKGKEIEGPYGKLVIEEFKVEDVKGKFDFVFLAVSGSFSEQFAQELAEGGSYVIDNSSAFRYHPTVPLVVPEINFSSISSLNSKLIANPNCTTAIAAMALWPVHKKFGGIKKLIVSTYQAASGAGEPGMKELLEGAKAQLVEEKVPEAKVFSHPLPFNCIPMIDKLQPNGYTKEEMKVAWETKKIFSDDSIAVSCTAVRIPTIRAHAEAITLETADTITPSAVVECLSTSPGVVVVDDPINNVYPMPLNCSGTDDVQVGRIRRSEVFGDNGVDMFVCGDQLLRGAALNAVLIAVKLVKEGM
uniref:aspartate-semialdehyde dehydrogenase n=1 Tax=Triparma pacifica TaxID=91992 RepID=A0A7S2QV06_9STRA|mmetsp:Transcript_142/g.200  ORF Transcript_142/g.200 Transcript_142/m.200 type:complete len:342 (+) Transcript_142:26-1051(+)